MKLIIFGAGASYDSIHTNFNKEEINIWQPPLANELFEYRKNFENIINKYPGAESFRSEINLGSDIEDFFQQKWNFVKGNYAKEMLSRIINTQFYLQELFNTISNNYYKAGLSNYDVIAAKAYEYAIATKEDICFVSFNYDLLFEKSLEKILNIKFKNIDDYINSEIKLIKPHGSCNWFKKGRKENSAFSLKTAFRYKGLDNYLYQNNIDLSEINLSIEDRITILSDNSDQDKSISAKINNPYFPQILIPLKTKDEFILPNTHLNFLNTYIHKVNEILIIGWKGNELYFLDFLNKALNNKEINITIVNAENKEIETTLSSFLKLAKFEHFEDFKISKYLNKKIDAIKGSFSSYVNSLVNNNYDNFFKYK